MLCSVLELEANKYRLLILGGKNRTCGNGATVKHGLNLAISIPTDQQF